MDLTADFFNDVRLSVISWHWSLSKPVLHIRHWKERMDCQSLTGWIHLSSYVEYRWEVCRHLPLKNSCDVISVSGWNDAWCFVVEISLFDMTPSTSALWKQKHPSLDKGVSWSCLRDAKESVSFHCRALQLVLQYEMFFLRSLSFTLIFLYTLALQQLHITSTLDTSLPIIFSTWCRKRNPGGTCRLEFSLHHLKHKQQYSCYSN